MDIVTIEENVRHGRFTRPEISGRQDDENKDTEKDISGNQEDDLERDKGSRSFKSGADTGILPFADTAFSWIFGCCRDLPERE
jgi:hypothetical protein